MPGATPENKIVAKTVVAAFGGPPRMWTYKDEAEKSSVDILHVEDSPQEGVTSYSTVDLSDAPLILDGEAYETRLEIAGVCESSCEEFGEAISTAAFFIINSGWFCYPGAIFPNVLSMYDCSETMQHFIFVPPFLWEDDLQTLELETKTVSWLLAVPISDAERGYVEAEGSDKLEDLFEQHQIDIFDIDRLSVV